jgi:protein translocase SecG subunit
MRVFILILQILFASGLVGLILLQSSKGGLGGGLGAGEFYRSKRGAERVVFTGTIVLAGLFFITSILSLFVH